MVEKLSPGTEPATGGDFSGGNGLGNGQKGGLEGGRVGVVRLVVQDRRDEGGPVIAGPLALCE